MIVENTHVEIGKNLRRAIALEPFRPQLVNHIAPAWFSVSDLCSR
jgi:hypothetical protein